MIAVRTAAIALCGDVVGRESVLCPGPGHSPKDRSLSVRLTPDGPVVHSFAGDDGKAAAITSWGGLASSRHGAGAGGIRATSTPPDQQRRRRPHRLCISYLERNVATAGDFGGTISRQSQAEAAELRRGRALSSFVPVRNRNGCRAWWPCIATSLATSRERSTAPR